MNDTVKDLTERRSIKRYTNRQINREDLQSILDAGMNAPSGLNTQSPIIVAIQDSEMREKLRYALASALGDPDRDPFYGAPTVCVVLSDSTKKTHIEDGSLVIGNMLNAAHALGLGSCWIHGTKELFATDAGKALLKEWGVGEQYVGVGHCILGYAAGDYPKKCPRKKDYIRYYL